MNEKTIEQRIEPSLWFAVILLGALALYLLMLPAAPELEWGDSGYYITLAHSLLAGKGLSLVVMPTDPVYPLVPVGYPLALAPLLTFFPTWYLPLRLLSVVLMLVAVALAYRYARPQARQWLALASTALFASNVLVVKSAAQPMSEALFLCCMLALFLLADRFVRLARVRWYDLVVLGLLLALPITVRYLGLPITAAVALYVLWQRRDWAALLAGLLGVIFTLLINVGFAGMALVDYFVTTLTHFLALLLPQGAATAGSTAAGAATAVADAGGSPAWGEAAGSLWYLFTVSLPGTFVPLFHGPQVQALFDSVGLGFVPPLVQLAIVFTLIAGFVLQVRRQARAAEWALLAYAATLVLVPTDWETLASTFRYWLPLAVVGYLYILMAVDAAAGALAARWAVAGRGILRTAPTALVALALLLLNVGRDVQESLLNPIVDRVPDIYLAKDWVLANTPADATILVANGAPALYGLYFQREVLPPPDRQAESEMMYASMPAYMENAASAATLEEILDMFEVDYITIAPVRWPDAPFDWSPYIHDTVLPLMDARPMRFPELWRSADGYTRVFQVLHNE